MICIGVLSIAINLVATNAYSTRAIENFSLGLPFVPWPYLALERGAPGLHALKVWWPDRLNL